MKPIKSTAEILAYKVLNRNVDEKWVQWAVDMLMAGFETDNLIILAGEFAPFNQFELTELTNKVFNELHLDFTDRDKTIEKFVYYLVDESLNERILPFKVLSIIYKICLELDYIEYLYDFYLLYCAKEDLEYQEYQYYWDDADRNTIDSIIMEYFKKWKLDFEILEKTEHKL